MPTPQAFRDVHAAFRFARYLVQQQRLTVDSVTYGRLDAWHAEVSRLGQRNRRYLEAKIIPQAMAVADRLAANHYDDYIVWVTLERLTGAGNG